MAINSESCTVSVCVFACFHICICCMCFIGSVLNMFLLNVWLPGRSPELFKCLRWVTNEQQGLKPPSVECCVTVVFL